ncbi:MAG: Gram-negative porin [Rhodobacteraceae bacterium HLUCCA08]|nr:MAG: Gram-negative porin [Rhodobacteraceae bacterium HLUCCA08]
MKSILLASASIVAFAGAAAAEVSFSAEATVGYNTDDAPFSADDNAEGFYWDGNVAVTLSQELDNGLTVGAGFDFDVADNSLGEPLESGGWNIFVESETAGLYVGDVAFAAETRWVSAGDMEQDNFSDADGEVALRADAMFNNIEASLSYVLADADGNVNVADDLNQLSLGVAADFGNVNAVLVYQEAISEAAGFYNGDNDDFNEGEMFGISVGTTFGGADVRLAYASDETEGENSLGLEASYPIGPVTVTGYYVEESLGDANFGLNVAYEDGPISVALDYADEQGTEIIGLEGSYDVGNGLVAYAGILTEDAGDRFYLAGEYDLGSGAALLVSYAEDDNDVDGDEIGANEYQRGTTVEVSFEF